MKGSAPRPMISQDGCSGVVPLGMTLTISKGVNMAKGPKKSVGTPEKAEAAATTAAAKAAAPARARAARPAKTAAPAAKAAAARVEKKKAAPRKAPAKAAAGSTGKPAKKAEVPAVTPEQRYRMIQDAAYFIAERNGFVGDNHAYWLQAEQAIDAELGPR